MLKNYFNFVERQAWKCNDLEEWLESTNYFERVRSNVVYGHFTLADSVDLPQLALLRMFAFDVLLFFDYDKVSVNVFAIHEALEILVILKVDLGQKNIDYVDAKSHSPFKVFILRQIIEQEFIVGHLFQQMGQTFLFFLLKVRDLLIAHLSLRYKYPLLLTEVERIIWEQSFLDHSKLVFSLLLLLQNVFDRATGVIQVKWVVFVLKGVSNWSDLE